MSINDKLRQTPQKLGKYSMDCPHECQPEIHVKYTAFSIWIILLGILFYDLGCRFPVNSADFWLCLREFCGKADRRRLAGQRREFKTYRKSTAQEIRDCGMFCFVVNQFCATVWPRRSQTWIGLTWFLRSFIILLGQKVAMAVAHQQGNSPKGNSPNEI